MSVKARISHAHHSLRKHCVQLREHIAQARSEGTLSFSHWWARSLTMRVVSIMMVVGLVIMALAGWLIVVQVRDQFFHRAVDSAVDNFDATWRVAQGNFDAVAAPSAGQMQEVANNVVVNFDDPSRQLLGATIMRTPGQDKPSFQIVEPFTRSSTQVRSLISEQMRQQTQKSEKIQWQSVNVGSQARPEPGVAVGATIMIPGAGAYELYAVYSLQEQESSIAMVSHTLYLGSVVLVALLALSTWIIVGFVIRPIQDARSQAQELAEGDFQARMRVHGNDELASLARSFNQMAESLEDQFTKLERMSKVQQEFVSAVSHELRTPVTTIRMAGQLIYDKREELPAPLRRSAELQHDQLINLDSTLADLLEISRFDAGAMALDRQESDVANIVSRAIEAQDVLAAEHNVHMHMLAEGDTRAAVEPRRIERIVRNLVVNALEHSEGKDLRVRVVGGDGGVCVEVSDHGVGLSPQQASHVFDRFWRADTARVRKSGGTGLGLTIAREDARLHGGKLQAAGELGLGSTFLLSVPRDGSTPLSPPLSLRVAAAQEEWAQPMHPLFGEEEIEEDVTASQPSSTLAGSASMPAFEEPASRGWPEEEY